METKIFQLLHMTESSEGPWTETTVVAYSEDENKLREIAENFSELREKQENYNRDLFINYRKRFLKKYNIEEMSGMKLIRKIDEMGINKEYREGEKPIHKEISKQLIKYPNCYETEELVVKKVKLI